jgi:hypothetical protein
MFQTVVIKGKPHKVHFPAICVHCAAPARKLVDRAEVYTHSDCEAGYWHEIVRARVPLCAACLDVHNRECPDRGLIRRIGLLFRSWHVLALVGSLGTTVFFLYRAAITPYTPLFGVHAPLWFVLFFGLLFLWILRGTWRDTEHLAAPEPSSVTAAVQIGENEAGLLQRRRHGFGFRNAVVAQRFQEANKHRVVQPNP